jgi:hypothetical protein
MQEVWRDEKLPAGKIVIPGVVSHATDLVEHLNWSPIASMAGTDCGMGGRVHHKPPGQVARSAQRRGNLEQEVVELSQKCLCGMNETNRIEVIEDVAGSQGRPKSVTAAIFVIKMRR